MVKDFLEIFNRESIFMLVKSYSVLVNVDYFLDKLSSPFFFCWDFTKLDFTFNFIWLDCEDIFFSSEIQNESHIFSSHCIHIPEDLLQEKLSGQLGRFLNGLNELDISSDDHYKSMLTTQFFHQVPMSG